MNAALADRRQKLVLTADRVFELRDDQGVVLVRFTDDRDRATADDGLDLLGLDHPVVERALARWRSTPPEELGSAINGAAAEPSVASWWLIEATTQKGEKRAFIQTLAVRQDGSRVPPLEHNGEALFKKPPAAPTFSVGERLLLLRQVIEPTLQRELRHRGILTDEGSFSAELLTWVETVSG